MHELEYILGLLVVVVILAVVADRLTVPYPILFVVGGLGLGFVPGLPLIELEPEIVFLLFLPPILFSAAYLTSWRDFNARRRPIALLAFGAVLTTTGAVAAVAHWAIPGLGWPTAFVLGAIVSPPDAVATTAIVGRLGVPRRIVTVLEGESLLNDATALVAYRFAVAAVVTGAFSLAEAGLRFVLVVVGGVAIGVAFGFALLWVLKRIDDPPLEVTVTLLAPVAAYLPAERLGVSGVLATVVAGLLLGRRSPTVLNASARLTAGAVWQVVVFLVNAFVFILIGLQLKSVLAGLEDRSATDLARYAVLIALTTIVIRLVWVFPAAYLPRLLVPRIREVDPELPWQVPLLTGWAGLRGVVTLASALALPRETDAGVPFPHRDLVIFLAFCVILATLVGQGLSLPALIRRLGLEADDTEEREEALARRETAIAALTRLDQLATREWVSASDLDELRERYRHRLDHVPESLDPAEIDRDHVDGHERLRHEALEAERRAAIGLRDRGEIGDEALRRVERDLDLAEERTIV